MALTTSLISFWELEEASGTRSDSHGTNHLSDNATVTQNTGKVGNCGQFTAANSEYLSCADNAGLSLGGTSSFTFCAWVYLDSLTTYAMIASQLGDHSTNGSWQLYHDPGSDAFIFSVSSDGTPGGFSAAVAGSSIATGTWYFVVGWYDYSASAVRIKVNDGTQGSASLFATFDSNANFRIGTRHNTPELFWNGRIDQVGFWKRVLTGAEITELYNSGAGRTYAYIAGSAGPPAATTVATSCRAGYLGSTGGDFHEPAIYYDTTYVAPTPATTFTPADAAAFQTALNSAVAGDEIRLTAGVTYTTGTGFTLPVKTGSSYIHIRSSAALTTEGTRVTPATAASFPRIVTNTNEAAIQAAPGAFYYRFINCDITSGSTATNGGLVRLGTGNETSTADFPHHIIFDRCWIHGHATSGGRRGVLFSGNYQAVIDSYVSDWKEVGADTQAICAWTGYGPYKITNCYLEGAGENVMFGGADTWIPALTPSDIEVRNNHFFKPLTWQFGHPSYAGTLWTVKNIFELKHARRVMCENNLFENCWPAGQNGYGIVFTVRNQQGSNSWATVSDVTFRNNEVRNSSNAINCLGQDFEAIVYPGGTPSQIAQRLRILDNLITVCGEPASSGVGNFVLITSGYADITIDHNTALHTGNIITVDYAASPGFRFTNNICQHNLYGILGTDHGSGNDTIAYYFPGSVITGNVIQSATNYSSVYPSGNFWPATLAAIGFTNYPTDLSLSPSSPYHNAGTDGTDIGYVAGEPSGPAFKAGWAASCNQMIV